MCVTEGRGLCKFVFLEMWVGKWKLNREFVFVLNVAMRMFWFETLVWFICFLYLYIFKYFDMNICILYECEMKDNSLGLIFRENCIVLSLFWRYKIMNNLNIFN